MSFLSENFVSLNALANMSQAVGARADYVQGGGGNTSVKTDGGLMAIKASGYCLSQVSETCGYAVLDGASLRRFYMEKEPGDFADPEKECAAATRERTVPVEGIEPLRPSVEAGFHCLLDRYVLHSHSVYANFAACCSECEKILPEIFAGAPYEVAFVPYVNPGAMLTFSIKAELSRIEKAAKKRPAVIFMQNHGVIVHGDDAESVLAFHADVNERAARYFQTDGTGFPSTSVEERDGLIYGTSEYVTQNITSHSADWFLNNPLYPDQMVFLTGTLFAGSERPEAGECRCDFKSGVRVYNMSRESAKTVEDTLCAVLFIEKTVQARGLSLRFMQNEAKAFIADWESEKYRKSLLK